MKVVQLLNHSHDRLIALDDEGNIYCCVTSNVTEIEWVKWPSPVDQEMERRAEQREESQRIADENAREIFQEMLNKIKQFSERIKKESEEKKQPNSD